MSRFEITNTPLGGLKRVKRNAISDTRGFLSRVYCADELSQAGWDTTIAQINHTCTRQKGALRGMHYQIPPYAEKKLVSCVRGKVWDVAVDLRRDSSTFLQWYAQELSAENQIALLIPEGFAHGFQVLSEEGAELIYVHSQAYKSEYERAVSVFDPKVKIEWPLDVTDISKRDQAHEFIKDDFCGIE
jgi:dTDP-4-dehydrorhamnose 3,5-epimerase